MAAEKKTSKTNADTGTVNQPVQTEKTKPKFSKSQLVSSDKYRNRRDLVDALLNDDEKYTMEQVDKMIENFMKGKVK